MTSIIKEELQRSSAEHTLNIVLDVTQVLLDSKEFYELPIEARSNMFNELRNVADFKKKLEKQHKDDTSGEGRQTT